MGKMLEVFKQANPKVAPRAEIPSLPSASSPEAPPSVDDADEMETSFIEVGGRNEKMEASADVMACATEARPFPSIPMPKQQEVALTPRVSPAYRNVRLQQACAAPAHWVFFSPRFAPELIVAHDRKHPVSVQYEALLGQILDSLGDRQSPVLYFLGAADHSGTTTTVLNLALTAAHRMDQTVTVVEGNVRCPALAQRIGLAAQHPESMWFQARKPANLRFVPWREQSRHSIAAQLEDLRADEGLILVDGPTLKDLSAADAALACDGLYVVACEEGQPKLAQNFARPIDGWIISQ